MSKVNLTAYTISIKEKFSRQQSENIDNIIGSGITLKQVIESAISRYSINNGNGVPFRDTTSQKALLFSSSQNSVYPTNTPRLDLKKVQLYHGEYGLVQDVLDTQTGVLQQGLIDENKSPVIDFNLTFMRDRLISTHAYFILQTYSLHGYKSTLEKLLQEELTHHNFNKNMSIKLEAIFSPELIDKIKSEGKIIDITLISQTIPRDQGDIITNDLSRAGLVNNNVKTIELAINAKSGVSLIVPRQIESFIESMKSLITNSDRTVFHKATNAKIADIKVQVELPDRNRTISINQEELQLREVMPLKDNLAIINNRLNSDYIFNEATQYGAYIANKYRRLFGD